MSMTCFPKDGQRERVIAESTFSCLVSLGSPFQGPVKLAEQLRAVAYLDDLQARVDALKRLQAETADAVDALLPSVLDKTFSGEL